MVLKDYLYKITSSNPDHPSFDLELISDCAIYRAHFPEQPITPGVCIIQIASELLGELYSKRFELSAVSNAKYLAVIDPVQTPELRYSFKKVAFDEEATTAKVTVWASWGEATFAKLSLVYRCV